MLILLLSTSNTFLCSYDVQLGRWMQPDPMIQHASPYLAMSNNPTIFTDPLGLEDGPLDIIGRDWVTGKEVKRIPAAGQHQYYWLQRTEDGDWESKGEAPPPFEGGNGGDFFSSPVNNGKGDFHSYVSGAILAYNANLNAQEAKRRAVRHELGRIEIAKQVTGGVGLAQFIQSSATTIAQSEKSRYVTRSAAYDRLLLGKYNKYLSRTGRVITGADIALSIGQYSLSEGTYSDRARLGVNLTIGVMDLSKDPYIGTTSIILGITETAGGFDWLYRAASDYEWQTKMSYPNAFGTVWSK